MKQGGWYKNSLIDRYLLAYYRNKGCSEQDIQKLVKVHVIVCIGMILIGLILVFGGGG